MQDEGVGVIRIVLALLGSLAFGAVLAAPLPWPVLPGAIGAVVLLAAAIVSKIVWEKRRRGDLDAPGWREIGAWHAVIGWGVVCGQLAMSLLRGVDLHLGSGNTLAIDNWTLGLAGIVAWLIIRPRDRTRDERDAEMDRIGTRTGYWTLTGALIVASVAMGFAPVAVQERLTPFVIGNILIVLVLLGGLAYATGQLVGYWRAALPDGD
jgi:hypothetical protein